MPGLFGRRCSPIRAITFLLLLGGSVFLISSLTSVSVPLPADSLQRIQDTGKKTLAPLVPANWRSGGAHVPPGATNGTASTASWYEHWSWLNPFGSSKDYAESRTVLPPLQKRCPIYAYYDQDVKKTGQTKIDNEVMALWRRAWWAAGMEPIILSLEDAREHGAYPKIVGDRRGEKLEYNIMRWLAWERMGTGVLSDFRVFPMPGPNDHVIPWLRRCDFGEKVIRFDGLGNAIFAGSGPAIKYVVSNVTLWKNIPVHIMSPAQLAANQFTVDPKPPSLAYYNKTVVTEKYHGMRVDDLPGLINSHLHSQFISRYSDGINVINPAEPKSDIFSLPSHIIAQRLAACPNSTLPLSCPPNLDVCTPCSEQNMTITLTRAYKNNTNVFTIGGIPHPLTLEGILYDGVVHQLRFIRRNSTRDAFLKTVTTEIAPKAAGAMFRAVRLKEVIAKSAAGDVDSLWTTSEAGFDEKEIEWTLGFKLPTTIPPPPQMRQSDEDQSEQMKILVNAKYAMKTKEPGLTHLRAAVEAWSLGDFEMWKFIAAFEARRKSEREAWNKREKTFGKGMEN